QPLYIFDTTRKPAAISDIAIRQSSWIKLSAEFSSFHGCPCIMSHSEVAVSTTIGYLRDAGPGIEVECIFQLYSASQSQGICQNGPIFDHGPACC
ncbi:hypothetical protein T310_6270, partial [Rasamsonia emersonii CBS 393.64]